jgi:inositol phosphorylceramide mannosyltransferase catalytic subunit
MKGKIPKRIIQTAKSSDLSLLSKAAVENIRLLNPDFEYLFFDDQGVDEFINAQYPEYRGVFYSFPFSIQRYDFFRYLAIYHFGGFYFDLDVFLASSLESLLDFGCVFPFEELTMNLFLWQEYGMDWEIGNYAFGAVAGHPFLQAITENCQRAQKEPEWVRPMMKSIPRMFRDDFIVLNTTGPGLVSRTLAEYPEAADQIKVLFPENVCDSTNWHRFGKFGVHLQEGRWRKPTGLLRRRLARFWETILRKKMYKRSAILGKSRSLNFRRMV